MIEALPTRHTPATRSQRIVARLIGAGLILAVYLVALAVMFVFSDSTAGVLLTMLLMFGLVGALLWLMFAKAQTPGYYVSKLVTVDAQTGQPAGVKLFIRNLLQAAISMVSCGIAEPIVSFVSFDGRSTWFDRTVGVRVVTADSLGPAGSGSAPEDRPTAQRVAVPPAGVVPVGIPADSGREDHTQPVDRDVTPAAPPVEAGWQAVQSAHAPIQQVPGGPAPAAGSAPAAPPRPAESSSGDSGGFISGLPFGSRTESVQPGTGQPPGPVGTTPPAHDRQEAAPPPAELVDQTVADVDFPDAPTPMLHLDDGERHLLGSATVLGRAPVAPADHPGAATVAIVDPTMKVSKTHALITVDGDKVHITDLGSTNGIRVGRDGKPADRLTPKTPFLLTVGDTVQIGGRTFEVSW